jgi:hypothetical protein
LLPRGSDRNLVGTDLKRLFEPIAA